MAISGPGRGLLRAWCRDECRALHPLHLSFMSCSGWSPGVVAGHSATHGGLASAVDVKQASERLRAGANNRPLFLLRRRTRIAQRLTAAGPCRHAFWCPRADAAIPLQP